MTDLGSIVIGGINLLLVSDDISAAEYPDPRYKEFYVPADSEPVTRSIRVHVHAGEFPAMNGSVKIFDSEESWSMFGRGDERRIVLGPPVLPETLWHTCLTLGTDDVNVYCGDRLLRRDGSRLTVVDPVAYPLDIMLIMYILAFHDGIIVHAAGVDVDGRGFMFPGRSGAGKSTFTGLISSRPETRILSDDRIVIRSNSQGYTACGTPWLGEAGYGSNHSAPLNALLFLRASDRNAVRRIPKEDAAKRLFPVLSIPWYDRDVVPILLSFADDLIENIPCYEFAFRRDADVGAMLDEVRTIDR